MLEQKRAKAKCEKIYNKTKIGHPEAAKTNQVRWVLQITTQLQTQEEEELELGEVFTNSDSGAAGTQRATEGYTKAADTN